MEQEVVADPDAMASDINTTGRVAIYGIYFDHDSYAVKSESEPALIAIAKMLKANQNLNVYVVGYTSRKNNVFRQNEPIHITSQIFGHKLVKVGDGYKVNITTDFLVIYDTGNVLGGQQNIYSIENISAIPMTDFTLDLTYTLSGASERIYNLQTTVNDKNSGKSTEFVTEIKIK